VFLNVFIYISILEGLELSNLVEMCGHHPTTLTYLVVLWVLTSSFKTKLWKYFQIRAQLWTEVYDMWSSKIPILVE
jgi:hypothetical protein